MLRPMARARMPGSPATGGSLSGRSISAMLTSVATASAALGGLPTTCSPHGSSRDSISISLARGRRALGTGDEHASARAP